MEQYQSMSKSIEGLRRPIIQIAIIGILANIIVLVTGIYLNRRQENQEYNTMETCLYGMRSVFDNNPTINLIDKSVISDTKNHPFEIEDITLVKVVDKYTCDVIAKDSKGNRSYRVTLERNSGFPHLFKVKNVKGQKIVSQYQWREL